MRWSDILCLVIIFMSLVFGFKAYQAFSDEPELKPQCLSVSEGYKLLGNLRDTGIEEQSLINELANRLMQEGKSQHEYFRIVSAVEYVYNRPQMSPEELKETTYRYCVDGDLK